MDLKKFGNFNWIEMDSKDQNPDLTRTKRIHFNPFSFAGYDRFVNQTQYSLSV